MSRRLGCFAGCLLAGWAVASVAAPPPPKLRDEGARARVEGVLAGATTREALDRLMGRSPAVCLAGRPGAQLCEWRLGNRDDAWEPLAEAIGTRDRLNVICELPTDGGRRAEGACTAHPRRSNRGEWVIPSARTTKGGRRRDETPSQARERYRRIADAALAEAGTLVELSRLMGALPDRCTEEASQLRVCLWQTTSHTWGHGTLVMSIGARKREKVRMECRLPADGSRRGPDSCRADVGA